MTILVTGSGGLIGSQTVRHFTNLGYEVFGVDNDTRGQLFGPDGSVLPTIRTLTKLDRYWHRSVDVRSRVALDTLFESVKPDLVVHCAAQPAHESPTPRLDWDINATGTVNVLDAVRAHAPDAVVVVLSTIKVYGQHPNRVSMEELETRYEPANPRKRVPGASWNGFSEDMSIDGSTHSVFGASKTAADIMAQEYGHSLGLRTVILRPGCLTGPGHAAVQAHGFLGYLFRCVAEGRPYLIEGDGKQVRDQIHAHDVVTAINAIWRDPPAPGSVFNLGGGRGTEVSVLEAVALAEEALGRAAKTEHVEARHGDHRWWVTDMAKFRARYPQWGLTRDLADIALELADRWRP